jgi:hypothetical protein
MQQQNDGHEIQSFLEMSERPGYFTPLDATRSKRLRFKWSEVTVLSGNLDVRGLGKKGQIRIGSTMYDVYGLACDLPRCQCDAYIVPVRQQEQS